MQITDGMANTVQIHQASHPINKTIRTKCLLRVSQIQTWVRSAGCGSTISFWCTSLFHFHLHFCFIFLLNRDTCPWHTGTVCNVSVFIICTSILFTILTINQWIYIRRYLFVSVGGCVLAIVAMGIYSALLFIPTLVFVLLLCFVKPSCIHTWAFWIQMLWQTFWHLLIQYREYYLHEPVSIRYV